MSISADLSVQGRESITGTGYHNDTSNFQLSHRSSRQNSSSNELDGEIHTNLVFAEENNDEENTSSYSNDLFYQSSQIGTNYVDGATNRFSVSSPTDATFSHDWRSDEFARDNHERVNRVNDALQIRGIRTYFEKEKLSPSETQEIVPAVIANSKCLVVFITKKYLSKVNLEPDKYDNCKFVFDTALNYYGTSRIIAVIMESRMRDTRKWKGRAGSILSGLPCVDMVEDDDVTFEEQCDELKERIQYLNLL